MTAGGSVCKYPLGRFVTCRCWLLIHVGVLDFFVGKAYSAYKPFLQRVFCIIFSNVVFRNYNLHTYVLSHCQHDVILTTYRSNEVMTLQCVKVERWLHWKLKK